MNNEKLSDGDKIVSEFILKNNPFSNDNISNKIVEDKSSLGQFLKRDKMFQDKLKSNKEKMIRDKNDELLLQISTKPKMNEKSRRIIKTLKTVQTPFPPIIILQNRQNNHLNQILKTRKPYKHLLKKLKLQQQKLYRKNYLPMKQMK